MDHLAKYASYIPTISTETWDSKLILDSGYQHDKEVNQKIIERCINGC
jgi:hypothetical protein